MARTVTMKGNPMELVGDEVAVGQPAPSFTLNYFDAGMQALTLEDLKGKPCVISVVPSLDTPTCAIQTKRFNDELASMGDAIHAVTVSRDLPFAQMRFCGAENVEMRSASDYKTGDFGRAFGLLLADWEILARAVLVLDADGNVVHNETVAEIADEPNYDAALAALKSIQ
ncbi:MAG: thiol peroxidase [Planctomycetota bacterium]